MPKHHATLSKISEYLWSDDGKIFIVSDFRFMRIQETVENARKGIVPSLDLFFEDNMNIYHYDLLSINSSTLSPDRKMFSKWAQIKVTKINMCRNLVKLVTFYLNQLSNTSS